MKFSYPTASEEEIAKLKKLVKRIPKTLGVPPAEEPKPLAAVEKEKNLTKTEVDEKRKYKSLFDGGIANVEVTLEPLKIDNPVQLLLMLMPEVRPYKWQFEQLMQVAGYLKVGDYKNKIEITDQNPYKLILSAANGSGKDMIIIAAAAVWFALTGVRNRVIITSSSFDQTKFQTEVHIRELVKRVNKRFGTLFRFNQFHYLVPELGSEIKLFATDEAGRAEGYHPFPGGRMMLIMNEAKSIKEELFDALSRCTGYSHWLEISSPGPRLGHMYRAASNASAYPNPVDLGMYYFRKVTAYECPHIPKAHIQAMAYDKGEDSPWFKSSILAEFSDFDEPIAIPCNTWDKCFNFPCTPQGNDIAIGLDLAAGGNENACFVRRGNRVIHFFAFRQEDTVFAANMIDKQLEPWKGTDYVFRADDGGVSHAINDMLRTKGWRILRTNNQSQAYNPKEYLNLGAQFYFHVKRLMERNDIILPGARNRESPTPPLYPEVAKLREQLTSRRYKGEDSTQGKYALEPKEKGANSPDRGDAFVLCFSSFHARKLEEKKEEGPKSYTIAELMAKAQRGELFIKDIPLAKGRFTYQTSKV